MNLDTIITALEQIWRFAWLFGAGWVFHYATELINSQVSDERLRQLLIDLVRSAEQVYGPRQGTRKREYVEQEFKKRVGQEPDPDVLESVVNQEFGKEVVIVEDSLEESEDISPPPGVDSDE